MTETTRRDFMKLMVAAGAVVVMPIDATQAEADAKVVGHHRSLFDVTMVETGKGRWYYEHEACPEPDLHFDHRCAGSSSLPFTTATLDTSWFLEGHALSTQERPPIVGGVETVLSFQAIMTEELNALAWEGVPITMRYTTEEGGYYFGTFVVTRCQHTMDL